MYHRGKSSSPWVQEPGSTSASFARQEMPACRLPMVPRSCATEHLLHRFLGSPYAHRTILSTSKIGWRHVRSFPKWAACPSERYPSSTRGTESLQHGSVPFDGISA